LKVLITNYTGDRQNWGCQSTSRGLLRFLGRHSNVTEIRTLPLKSTFPRLRGIPRAELRAELLALAHEECRSERVFRGVYDDDEIALFEWADLVLFQGEGTMVGNSFYNGEALFAGPIAAARLFRTKTWSINQTIFSICPNFTDFLSAIYRSDVFARNFVRETASLHFARSIGAIAHLLPDLAFYDDLEAGKDAAPETQRYAAVCGMARIERLDREVYYRLIGSLIDLYGHVKIVASTNMDMEMCRDAVTQFGRQVSFVGSDNHRRAAFDAIRQAEILVSGRYHMNIFAAKAATPFIPLLSNTHKNEGLSMLLDYPLIPRCLDTKYDARRDIEHMGDLSVYRAHLEQQRNSIFELLNTIDIFSEAHPGLPTPRAEWVSSHADYFIGLNSKAPN
jgi:polysaccharide pyruvyl transferase WcaK-like protein